MKILSIRAVASTAISMAVLLTTTLPSVVFATSGTTTKPNRAYFSDMSNRLDLAKKKHGSVDLAKDSVLREEFAKSPKVSLSDKLRKNGVPDKEMKKAVGILSQSFKKDAAKNFRVFLRSEMTESEVRDTYAMFDSVTVTKFSQEGGTSVYQVKFPSQGRLGKLFDADLTLGQIPDVLPGNADLIEPTYITTQISTGAYLSGESLQNMWGQVKTKATDYQYGLSLQPKVRVGIVDTGILSTHPDLASNMWKNPKEIAGNNIDDDGNGYIDDVMGYNFIANSGNALDDQGHGTHVAGIIGSSINGAGSFGTNSNASLVALKVLDSTGAGSSYDIAEAINYAANNGIPVINLSLGGTGNPANDMICSAIASARLKGTLSVVAAGNENADVSTKVPAGCKDALTVGAVDSNLFKASFSNYGAEVDVSAPGVSIYSTYNNGGYVLMSGTSMATPFVAGLAASIKAYKPSFGPNDLFAVIKNDTTTAPVNSAVNIGRFVLMSGEMSNIGVLNDAQIPTGGTGSGSTGSGSTGSGTTNRAPTVVASAKLTSANTYQITATGSDTDGTITSYEYLNGTSLIASGAALKSIQIAITQNTTITVRVKDNAGATATTNVSLAYTAPVVANVAPSLTLSVARVKTVNRMSLATSDTDGTLARVDIYVGGVLIYYVLPNTKNFSGYLDFPRDKTFIVKVVSTDNRGLKTEKSITVK